jgi:hypothetical protein
VWTECPLAQLYQESESECRWRGRMRFLGEFVRSLLGELRSTHSSTAKGGHERIRIQWRGHADMDLSSGRTMIIAVDNWTSGKQAAFDGCSPRRCLLDECGSLVLVFLPVENSQGRRNL